MSEPRGMSVFALWGYFVFPGQKPGCMRLAAGCVPGDQGITAIRACQHWGHPSALGHPAAWGIPVLWGTPVLGVSCCLWNPGAPGAWGIPVLWASWCSGHPSAWSIPVLGASQFLGHSAAWGIPMLEASHCLGHPAAWGIPLLGAPQCLGHRSAPDPQRQPRAGRWALKAAGLRRATAAPPLPEGLQKTVGKWHLPAKGEMCTTPNTSALVVQG